MLTGRWLPFSTKYQNNFASRIRLTENLPPSYAKLHIDLLGCSSGDPSSGIPKNVQILSVLEAIHPYATLPITNKTFPQDLTLDVSECWTMYNITPEAKQDRIMKEMNKLCPDVFFKSHHISGTQTSSAVNLAYEKNRWEMDPRPLL